MEACAAEAVVVVLLLLCSDNRGDRYFRKLPFSGFLVASFFDTHASTVFFCGFFGLFFIFYKIVLPRTHLVQVHRCTVHPERNDAPPGKRATGPACIPSPTTTTTTTCVCVCVSVCVCAPTAAQGRVTSPWCGGETRGGTPLG